MTFFGKAIAATKKSVDEQLAALEEQQKVMDARRSKLELKKAELAYADMLGNGFFKNVIWELVFGLAGRAGGGLSGVWHLQGKMGVREKEILQEASTSYLQLDGTAEFIMLPFTSGAEKVELVVVGNDVALYGIEKMDELIEFMKATKIDVVIAHKAVQDASDMAAQCQNDVLRLLAAGSSDRESGIIILNQK